MTPFEIDQQVLIDAGYDPTDPFVSGMHQMNEHYGAKLQAMNEHYGQQTAWLHQQMQNAWGHVQQMQQQSAQRARHEVMQQLDVVFDEMESDLYGNSSDLSADAQLRRQEAAGQMNVLAQAYQSSGRPVPSLAVLRDQSLGISIQQQSPAARDQHGRFVARGSKANSTGGKTGREIAQERIERAGLS